MGGLSPRSRRLIAAAAIGLLTLAGTVVGASAPRKHVTASRSKHATVSRKSAPATAKDAPAAAAAKTTPIPYRLLPIDERVTMRGRVDGELVMVPDGELTQESELADVIALTHATQPYRPRPALWRIREKDSTIYLFGTIHSLPPGFRWRSPRLDQVIASADRLVLESTDGGFDGAGPLLLGDVAPGSPRLPPLADRLLPEQRPALQTFQATLPKAAVKLLDGMPTWVAAMAIGYVRELRAGTRPGPGADDWLEARFRGAHKPIEAIEDSAKVVATVNAVPEDQQRAMLMGALAAPERSGADLEAPAHAWAKGDIGTRSPLVAEIEAGDRASTLRDPLLTRRNAIWAENLANRLKQPGVVLFAAGAGHFLGDDSVIALLKKRGIKVTRVE